MGAFFDDDREQPVFQRIIAENIRNLGTDNDAKAVIRQAPRRMFTRGAAAEIMPCDEDF